MHKKAEDGGLRPNIKMSHSLMCYPSSHFRLIWHLYYNDLFIIITLYRNIKLCSEEWEERQMRKEIEEEEESKTGKSIH